MNESIKKAKEYVEELFTGASKIVSFCTVYDCTKCISSTKLYKRVIKYHNTKLVQTEFSAYASELQNIKANN